MENLNHVQTLPPPLLDRLTPDRVTLTHPRLSDPTIRVCAQEIEVIPGVRFDQADDGTIRVDIPRTAFALDPVNRFFSLHKLANPGPTTSTVDVLWDPVRPLLTHQAAAIKFLVERNGGLLCDQIGLAKTSTAIAAAKTFLAQQTRPSICVIVGPKYLRSTWRKELEVMGALPDSTAFCALEGRNVDAPGVWRANALWYYCHYEIINAWWSRLNVLKPAVVIADELHFCKNSQSQRFKAVELAMLRAPLRLGLTGTPILNRIGESWALLHLIGGKWTWGGNRAFRQRYAGAVYDGYSYPDGEPTNMGEFHARLGTCYIRRTAQEVGLELPALMRSTVECDLTAEQAQKYSTILKGRGPAEILAALTERRLSKETLEWASACRKLTSKVKLPVTIAEISSALDQDESVVCFTWMRATATQIANTLCEAGHGRVFTATGDDASDMRAATVEAFQEGGGAIIATYGALSVGVTLTRARIVIMHDLDWVPANMLQAEGRVYRYTATRAVQSKWMVARGTLDQIIAQKVLRKADLITEALGDTEPQGLGDLLSDTAGAPTLEQEVEDFVGRWSIYA